MGVMTSLSRVFARRRTKSSPRVVKWPPEEGFEGEVDTSQLREAMAAMAPSRPVSVDAGVEDEMEEHENGDVSLVERPRGKNKQELIAELQKSYNEVITLVRKLDDHLDRHETRSERIVEMAERLSNAMDGIERAEERHVEIVDAVGALARAIREGQERADGRHEAELASLARIETVLEQCHETDRATRHTLGELRVGIDAVASSHDRMGAVLERMHARDETRDERLEEMVARTSRLMIWLVSICAVGVGAAILIGTFVATKL